MVSLRTWARVLTEPWAAHGSGVEPLPGEGYVRDCPHCGHTVFAEAMACPRCGHRYVNRLATRTLRALVWLVVIWGVGIGLAYALFRAGYDAVSDRGVSHSGTGQAISDVVDYILMVGSAALAIGALVIGAGMTVESFETGKRAPTQSSYRAWERIDWFDLSFRVGGPFLSLAALCVFGLLGCGIAALILTGV